MTSISMGYDFLRAEKGLMLARGLFTFFFVVVSLEVST